MSHNPRFIEIVNRSWASYKKDGEAAAAGRADDIRPRAVNGSREPWESDARSAEAPL